MPIILKNEDAIKKIAIAGNIIYEIFCHISKLELTGKTTEELDKIIEAMIQRRNAIPTFLNYRGFPKNSCISINDEIVHGIPGPRVIKEHDIVKLDVGVTYQGYIADAARTFPAGEMKKETKKLLSVTKEALGCGITMAKAGNKISDISRAIQQTVETNGFSVVRELTGHGVGKQLHEEPMIPNFICEGPKPEIKKGMVLAIEPMVNMGGFEVKTAANNWTISTKDGSLSCHYEDTIAILEKGNINLTRVVES
ncbi:type I methionyl aminopeptidase [candidate division WOR-3 bacterium RBG_13_43_14]|uniref:Methionine aminopeptidase n=1 Tax=candidate division WOR-3 bacterium RBG_13_43_14 TaxID=1802590 RepID=A0A1F4UC10_UNCW3|nr:MAG: type I methionyl aminopeptidase [candidate division WOR-3 bacterium RBG_13_43_14]